MNANQRNSQHMRPGDKERTLCGDLGRNEQEEPDQKVHACDWNRRKVGIGRRGQRSQQGPGEAGCWLQHDTASIKMQRKAMDLVFSKGTTAVGPTQEAGLQSAFAYTKINAYLFCSREALDIENQSAQRY